MKISRKLFKLLSLDKFMLSHKRIRTKGKISFTRYFRQFKVGDYVAVDIELSEIFGYAKKLQGRTGKVFAKRGNAYEIELNDLKSPKRYLIKPIHLKKIEVAK